MCVFRARAVPIVRSWLTPRCLGKAPTEAGASPAEAVAPIMGVAD
jgi:hypothetical protein